jgi:hypothetical protein
VVGAEDLVPRLERQPPHHHVQAGRRVRHEHKIIGRRADVGGQDTPRLGYAVVGLAAEEAHRLRLDGALEVLVLLEDRPRHRPERPVVEEVQVRFEQEEVAQRLAHRSVPFCSGLVAE